MTEQGAPDVDGVELVGLDGFGGTVNGDDWPIVGRPVTVTRAHPPGSWLGAIAGFAQGTRAVYECTLASGERRHGVQLVIGDGAPRRGTKLPIRGDGHEWTATVTERDDVAAVKVSCTIRSGALRRRELFYLGVLPTYFIERPDGSAVLMRLS